MSEERVAIVTGSAVGIGQAIAVALAEQDMRVACLDIDGEGNAATVAAVTDGGGEAVAHDCDVADRAAVTRTMGAVATQWGRIDVLVNNAAVWLDCSLTGGDVEAHGAAFERSIAICTFGAFWCAAAAVPVMRRNGGGDVVNVLTDHVKPGHLLAGAPTTGYDVAKFGLWRLTETWAAELAPLGIRVNGLCFGATDTPMLRAVAPHLADAGLQPADVADAVRNVLAHGAGGPTGQSPLFGLTGAPLDVSRAEIAALAPQAGAVLTSE